LVPDVFSSYDDFDEYLQQTSASASNSDGGGDSVIIRQLHSILRPFLLRRLKSQVEKSLLPKKRINLYIGMSDMQKEWYKKILSKDVESLNGVVKDTREGKTRLLNIVMQLRKCCNHPYLFDGAEPQPFTTDQHLVDNAGKMVLLDKLLLLLKQQGSRVLLFSQMSRMLDILEDYMVWKGYQYCRIDGQTSHEDRVRDIDEFNREGSEKFIFLLTTRAGGLGINLATADSVIMYDSDWNPQVDLQAEDRAHRIGQKKQVVVFRFVTEHAIEEKVIERAASKLRLDQLVIQQQLANSQIAAAAAAAEQKLGKNDLVGMIRHGAADLFKNNSSEDQSSKIMELSIEEILKKGEERTRTLEQKFQKFGLDDLQNFSLDSQNMYQFEGKDFKSGANDSGAAVIAQDWIAPITKRDKGFNADGALMSTGGPGGGGYQNDSTSNNKQPKPPRYMNAQEYQLYPSRLYELQKKELYAYWNEVGYRLPNSSPENELISVSIPLTDEERTEFEQLKLEGFPHWTKREYGLFLKACEKYGRDQLDAIAQEIEGKTKDEVVKYSQAFWKLYKQLSDYQAIIEKIEKGEEKIRKRHEVQQVLTKLLRQYKFPKEQLYIPYGTNTKGKNYTEEEDRFMIVQLERFGYQNEDSYERIRAEFRKDPSFRFDWFIKSRTASELARRCQTLINMLMKDQLLNVSAASNENQEDGMGSKESLASTSTGTGTNNKRKVEDVVEAAASNAVTESSKKKK
jgi:SWI/SNF-related matrix-associated actin-dependent regulator of chromatin subfamily A member 5